MLKKNIPFLSRVSNKERAVSKYDFFSKYWQVHLRNNAQDEKNLLQLVLSIVKVAVTNDNSWVQ